MKNVIKHWAYWVICLVFVTSMSSCSDDENDDVTQIYNAGFTDMEASGTGDLEFLSDMKVIEDTFLGAVGASEAVFSLKGTVKDCDAKIASACKNAETQLNGQVWHGTYVYTITNVSTGTAVYTFSVSK